MFGLDKERVIVQEAVLITSTLNQAEDVNSNVKVCRRITPKVASKSPVNRFSCSILLGPSNSSKFKPFSPYDGYVLKTTRLTSVDNSNRNYESRSNVIGSVQPNNKKTIDCNVAQTPKHNSCGAQKLSQIPGGSGNIRLPQVQYNGHHNQSEISVNRSHHYGQTRSQSVDHNSRNGKTPPYTPPQLTRARQRSVSSHGCARRSIIKRNDHHDDVLKRSRIHNGYELSQDLLDKQVEMLERKYGGSDQSRQAALTIQRAFRKYCMVKKFMDITKGNCLKAEKRLSRRFNTLDFSNLEAVFNEQAVMEQNRRSMSTSVSTNGVLDVKSHCVKLYQDANDPLMCRSNKPSRSMSMRESNRPIITDIKWTTNACHCAASSEQNNLYSPVNIQQSNNNNSDISTYTNHVNADLGSQQDWSSKSGHNAYANSHNNQQTRIQQPILQRRSPAFSEDSAIGSSKALSSDGYDISTDHCTDDVGVYPQDVIMRRSSSSNVNSCHTIPLRTTSSWHSGQDSRNSRKVPPVVPKRTTSILSSVSSTDQKSKSSSEINNQGFVLPNSVPLKPECKLTSSSTEVESRQKTGKVSSSPVWKRKAAVIEEQQNRLEDKRLSNISETSEDSLDTNLGGYSMSPPTTDILHSYTGNSFPNSSLRSAPEATTPATSRLTEIQRKRQYRVGLNLFNKKPEKGIQYLIQRGFLENSPQAVARFLLSRKGLSKQNIGDYLGNLQDPFNMAVLDYFAGELDLAGMQVDVALRKFQTHFRLPGEAQKIERLMEVFAHRYCECNRDIVSRFQNLDTVFILAFAIIMLNTDLHTPSLKQDRRMKLENFINNLRGVDDGCDIERDMLAGIYERIKVNDFRPGSDHVSQVMKVQQSITGKNPILALPHRRLVCYCRLYEVPDVNKRERTGLHQREVFLFNDLLVVTKIFSKKKSCVTYSFRQSFPLYGLNVSLFESPYYTHGIRLSQRVDDKVLIVFNARNEHDRTKFVEDLKESIHEMDEMENLRIEGELEKQKLTARTSNGRCSENRDSGVADMEINAHANLGGPSTSSATDDNKDGSMAVDGGGMKRTALSNSLLDLHEQCMGRPMRRGSAGSLDSGMSISFQSSAASTVSRDSSPHQSQTSKSSNGSSSALCGNKSSVGATRSASSASSTQQQQQQQQGFLGGLFNKKGKTSSKGNVKSTDV